MHNVMRLPKHVAWLGPRDIVAQGAWVDDKTGQRKAKLKRARRKIDLSATITLVIEPLSPLCTL